MRGTLLQEKTNAFRMEHHSPQGSLLFTATPPQPHILYPETPELGVWTAVNSQHTPVTNRRNGGLPDGAFAQGFKTVPVLKHPSSSCAVFETGLSNSSNKTCTCQLKPGLTPESGFDPERAG